MKYTIFFLNFKVTNFSKHIFKEFGSPQLIKHVPKNCFQKSTFDFFMRQFEIQFIPDPLIFCWVTEYIIKIIPSMQRVSRTLSKSQLTYFSKALAVFREKISRSQSLTFAMQNPNKSCENSIYPYKLASVIPDDQVFSFPLSL